MGKKLAVFFCALILFMSASTSIPAEAKTTRQLLCNCVKYARYLQPSLKYGLVTKQSKQAAVNSKTPYVGATILTSEGFWGHAGHVLKRESGWIYIEEANYIRCQVTYRWVKEDFSHIYGYYLSPIQIAKIEEDKKMEELRIAIVALPETINEAARYASKMFEVNNIQN